MEFGVTGKSKRYGMEGQYQKNEAAAHNAGMSFAELAAAKSNELFMGETYQERLDKIGDKNSANAFREAYAKKMAGSVDYVSAVSQLFNAGNIEATNFADVF